MSEPIPSSWDNWLGASLPSSKLSDTTLMAWSQPWGKHTMEAGTHYKSGLFYVPENQLLNICRTAQQTRISGMSSVWLPPSFLERTRTEHPLSRVVARPCWLCSVTLVGPLFWIWWERRLRDGDLPRQIMDTTMLNRCRQRDFKRQIHHFGCHRMDPISVIRF